MELTTVEIKNVRTGELFPNYPSSPKCEVQVDTQSGTVYFGVFGHGFRLRFDDLWAALGGEQL